MLTRLVVVFAELLLASMVFAAPVEPLPVVRVAALKFGTVNWELDVIHRRGLDAKHGFKLETLELVSNNSSAVALQGGAVDIIVTDWLWVARQHASQRYYGYFPYSTAVGELLVPGDSELETLTDLGGKSLGVAGGSEDKTWQLFRAHTRRQSGYDLADAVKPRYAAPPLLNSLAASGQVDAIMTYWHFSAALKAQGYRTLLSLDEVLKQFGITEPVPILGWVFKRDWGRENSALVNAFLSASYDAKRLLLHSDSEWEALKPHMFRAAPALFEELKRGYRQGVPQRFTRDEIAAIDRVAGIVATGRPATSPAKAAQGALPEDMFWRQFDLNGPLVSHAQ